MKKIVSSIIIIILSVFQCALLINAEIVENPIVASPTYNIDYRLGNAGNAGEAKVVKTDADSGSYAFRLGGFTSRETMGKVDYLLPVSVGETYVFKMAIKVTGTPTVASVGFQGSGYTYIIGANMMYNLASFSTWKQVEYSHKVTAADIATGFYFTMVMTAPSEQNGAAMYVDTVSIGRVGIDENIFKDESFESNEPIIVVPPNETPVILSATYNSDYALGNINNAGEAKIAVAESDTGHYCLKLGGFKSRRTDAKVDYLTAVEAGKKYTFKMAVKIIGVPTAASIGYQGENYQYKPGIDLMINLSAYEGWKDISFSYIPTQADIESGFYFSIKFSAPSIKLGAAMLIDTVSIMAENTTINLFPDINFENISSYVTVKELESNGEYIDLFNSENISSQSSSVDENSSSQISNTDDNETPNTSDSINIAFMFLITLIFPIIILLFRKNDLTKNGNNSIK